MKKNKGFTLIELLVVIAIIGILSSIVLTSVNSSRAKARIAVAQTTMKGVFHIVYDCVMIDDNKSSFGDNNNLHLTNKKPIAGEDVCSQKTSSVVGTWPVLPTPWVYDEPACPGDYNMGGNYIPNTFAYMASGDNKTIICTQSGCKTTARITNPPNYCVTQ